MNEDKIVIHGKEYKQIVGSNVHTSPIVPEGKAFVIQWCEVDDCPVAICGGPHYEIETTLGIEILRKGQEPIGRPIEKSE